jgi:aldehyde dehydrogenase
VQDRAAILFKIADRMEQNLELLATAETWDNGKPIRETMAADVPLAIDHFRYFASCIRAQEGGSAKLTATPWRITSTNRWAWSGKLFRGTSRC